MMFILSFVGATTTLTGALEPTNAMKHDYAAELADVTFEHPLGEWVEPSDVLQVETADDYTPDIAPWTWENELEFKNLYLEMEDEARMAAQVARFRQLIREDYILAGVGEGMEEEGEFSAAREDLGFLEKDSSDDEEEEANRNEELAAARGLQLKRHQALEQHGWQPALLPPAGPSSELDASLLAPPSSVVETDGELLFEDASGQRRRLAQYMPNGPANCLYDPNCHQGKYHNFGGSGGGWCHLCNRHDGSPCTSRFKTIRISGKNLITAMQVWFNNWTDNESYAGEYIASYTWFGQIQTKICGKSETEWKYGVKWHWYGPTPYMYKTSIWKKLDLNDWSCITAVKGRSGVYLDGLQFVGYKQNGQNNYSVKTSEWFGGHGGSYWEAHAPQGKCLTGMKVKSGNKIDKIYLYFGGFYNKNGQGYSYGR